MSNYLLAEFVTRMRVASKSHWKSVKILKSNFILQIINLLYKEGFIRGFLILKNEDNILVFLKYYKNKASYYSLFLISKPGRRVYWSLDFLSRKNSEHNLGGFYIISTTKGLMTSTGIMLGARITGEVLLKVKV